MKLKILQLNIYMGKWMDRVLSYIQKNDYDILCFQEVAGGHISFDNTNGFKRIMDLGLFDGELCVSWRLSTSKNSFFGNATFFRPSFTLIEKTEIRLREYKEIKNRDSQIVEENPIAPLSLLLEKDGIKLRVVNAHLAWSPTDEDTPEKLRQGNLFYEYLQTINEPFIITGDFNVSPHTQVIKWIDSIGKNLISENKITNTLNPRLHRAKDELFPPGLAVDYIYVSENIKVNDFRVLDDDLSDHLGLALECEIVRS